MKQFKFYIVISIAVFLSSCGTLKEGFSNQKKNNSDEFLVEKKSPLVMPPEYNKLPLPKDKKNKKNSENDNIKLLIKSIEKKNIDNKKVEVDENFEESILEKIKNN